mmetsp:Transcript_46850/g.85842  ORF Transcript_46850/g.85842 Transcript_46850/m.85842 type:complete len:282 (-) Transcript_46850:213-1058(-)
MAEILNSPMLCRMSLLPTHVSFNCCTCNLNALPSKRGSNLSSTSTIRVMALASIFAPVSTGNSCCNALLLASLVGAASKIRAIPLHDSNTMSTSSQCCRASVKKSSAGNTLSYSGEGSPAHNCCNIHAIVHTTSLRCLKSQCKAGSWLNSVPTMPMASLRNKPFRSSTSPSAAILPSSQRQCSQTSGRLGDWSTDKAASWMPASTSALVKSRAAILPSIQAASCCTALLSDSSAFLRDARPSNSKMSSMGSSASAAKESRNPPRASICCVLLASSCKTARC